MRTRGRQVGARFGFIIGSPECPLVRSRFIVEGGKHFKREGKIEKTPESNKISLRQCRRTKIRNTRQRKFQKKFTNI